MIYKRFLSFIYLLLCAQIAFSEALTITVTEGYKGAKPVAIVPFESASELPENISDIIFSDLKRSGRFNLQNSNQFPALPHHGNAVQFPQWRAIDSEYLIIGGVKVNGPGGYIIRFEIFDVVKGELLKVYNLTATENQLRRAAHKAADLIYQVLEGVPGDFSSRIAYITTNRLLDGRDKITLNVADADG